MSTRSFFSGFVVALVLGVPFSLAAISFTADQMPTVVSALLGAIAVVVGLTCAFVLFRGTIFNALRLKADTLLNDLIAPAVSTLNHTLEGNRTEAVEELGRTLNYLASWYVRLAGHRWIMATLVGLLAAFATILGSALLARQNSLIVEQNATLREQNQSLQEQIKLNSEQVKLALAQIQAGAVSETTRTARELMLKAWEVEELRPLVDRLAPPSKNPQRLDGFIRILIQHHVGAYLNSRLGYFPTEYKDNVERDLQRFFCNPVVQKLWKDVEQSYSEDVKESSNSMRPVTNLLGEANNEDDVDDGIYRSYGVHRKFSR